MKTKKYYIAPQILVIQVRTASMLMTSGDEKNIKWSGNRDDDSEGNYSTEDFF